MTGFEMLVDGDMPVDELGWEPGRWWNGYQNLSAEDYGMLRRALGPFPDGEVELVGTIYYNQTELDGSTSRRKNPLVTRISLAHRSLARRFLPVTTTNCCFAARAATTSDPADLALPGGG